MTRRLGLTAVVLSAVCFGAMPVFARLATSSGMDTVSLLAVRFASAAVVLWGLVLIARRSIPRGRTLATLIAMGAVGYVAQSYCYFEALTMAPAGLVALLFYLYPVLVTAGSAAFLGERLTVPKAVALALALGGTALMLGRPEGGRSLGIVLGLLSGALYAVYLLVGSRVLARAGSIASSAVIISCAATVYGGVALASGFQLPTSSIGWAGVAALTLVSTVAALVLLFVGMRSVAPGEVATVSAVEPGVAVALAVALLGEPLTWNLVAGGALVVVAVVTLSRAGAVGSAADEEISTTEYGGHD